MSKLLVSNPGITTVRDTIFGPLYFSVIGDRDLGSSRYEVYSLSVPSSMSWCSVLRRLCVRTGLTEPRASPLWVRSDRTITSILKRYTFSSPFLNWYFSVQVSGPSLSLILNHFPHFCEDIQTSELTLHSNLVFRVCKFQVVT